MVARRGTRAAIGPADADPLQCVVGDTPVGRAADLRSPLPRYSGGEGSGMRGRNPRKRLRRSEWRLPLAPTLSPGVPGERERSAIATWLLQTSHSARNSP